MNLDIIAHQKAQLEDAERRYMLAVTSGNYDEAQYQAKRFNRIRTSLVQLGVLESLADIDRQKCEAEDRE